MPSDLARRLIGEGSEGIPKPSSIFRDAYPKTGDADGVRWKTHTVVGVAPVSVDAQVYEDWLYELALSNVDSDHPVNEVPVPELEQMTSAEPSINGLLKQAKQIARHTGADRVAFTSLDGLE